MLVASQSGALWMVSKPPGEQILFPIASLPTSGRHVVVQGSCDTALKHDQAGDHRVWGVLKSHLQGMLPNLLLPYALWEEAVAQGSGFAKVTNRVAPSPLSKLLERLTNGIPCFHLSLPPVPTAICPHPLQFLPHNYFNEAVFPTAISDLQIKTTVDVPSLSDIPLSLLSYFYASITLHFTS